MTAVRRWIVVALGLVVIVAVPLALRSVPASGSDASAAELLDKVNASDGVAYSGYAESLGTLQLPVTDTFTDVGQLFGERTRLRVWWRSSDDWRVDKLLTSGEVDSFRHGRGLVTWDYEKAEAVRTRVPDVRLPGASDLLPPQLARLLLADATPDEVSRLPAKRVAGISAPGIRLTPSSPLSTVAAVDVWLDEASGLPLRVELYADGADGPAISSEFMQVSVESPDRATTAFTAPPGADVRYEDELDIADAANQYAPVLPPRTVVGLDRDVSRVQGAVGLYGRGVTRLVAIPLWDRAAEPLRDQLRVTPGAVALPAGDAVSVGPLNVLLTEYPDGGGWLVSGTVTQQALVDAARELRAESRFTRRVPS